MLKVSVVTHKVVKITVRGRFKMDLKPFAIVTGRSVMFNGPHQLRFTVHYRLNRTRTMHKLAGPLFRPVQSINIAFFFKVHSNLI